MRVLAKSHIKATILQENAKRQAKDDYNYAQACALIQEQLDNLDKLAQSGNIAAINAKAGLLRELNDISGLHKRIFIDQTDQQRELTETEKAEAQRIAQIRLRTG